MSKDYVPYRRLSRYPEVLQDVPFATCTRSAQPHYLDTYGIFAGGIFVSASPQPVPLPGLGDVEVAAALLYEHPRELRVGQ